MNDVEKKNIDALWSEDFEKFIVAASATGDDDPCGGSSGGNSSASSSSGASSFGSGAGRGGSGLGGSGMANASQRSPASITRQANLISRSNSAATTRIQSDWNPPRIYSGR